MTLEVGVDQRSTATVTSASQRVPPNNRRRKADKKVAILTPIDEAVVVLLVCLGAISFPLEVNSGNPFGPASTIIVQSDFTKSADSGVEEFL